MVTLRVWEGPVFSGMCGMHVVKPGVGREVLNGIERKAEGKTLPKISSSL